MPHRILVVEDDSDTGELLKLALDSRGYEVALAGGADEALDRLRSSRFDLVVTDYDMPRKTGAQLLVEARQSGLLDRTAALMITAHPDPRGLEPGTPLMRKPLDVERLLVQVQTIVGRQPDPSAPGQADTPPPVLRLYVNRASPFSERARQRMQELLAGYDLAGLRFEVCDLLEHVEEAARDRVVFTPTLVYRGKGATAWVLGDLSDTKVVQDLLALAGVRPKAN
jgi:DNA-binding response OmpR family regulator